MPTGLVTGPCEIYEPLHYYGLLDPRRGTIRYVGRSFAMNLKYRYGTHARGFASPTRAWVLRLASEGYVPHLRVLETVTRDEFSPTREGEWYDHFAGQGNDMVNGERPRPLNWRGRKPSPLA